MKTFCTVALTLALASSAMAAPAGGSHGGEHGEAAVEADHGATGGHGSADGAEAHGTHAFTADDDHDGKANWMDPDSALFSLDDLGFHAFNVTLLLAVLVAFTRRPIGDTLKERALGVRKELTESANARDEAQQRYATLEARLEAMASEVEAMRAEARREADLEEQQLIARAHAEAQRIAETAERNIRDEVTRAQLELRREAVELAVKLAEATLRDSVTAEDRSRLAHEFLDSLKSEVAHA